MRKPVAMQVITEDADALFLVVCDDGSVFIGSTTDTESGWIEGRAIPGTERFVEQQEAKAE